MIVVKHLGTKRQVLEYLPQFYSTYSDYDSDYINDNDENQSSYNKTSKKSYNFNNNRETNKNVENMLDGCYHVYLDVGSNIGTQIRKLFEPETFPKASFQRLFKQYFGSVDDRAKLQKTFPDGDSYICAVGFEPNSHHTEYLKAIETSHRKCGWHTTFLTESAVSNKNGVTKFYSDNSFVNNEWGGGILPPDVMRTSKTVNQGGTYKNVTLIRLSEFINKVVANRRLPQLAEVAHLGDKNQSIHLSPRILMKMDIEGSEVDVVPDLIFSGSLQFINLMIVEWHPHMERKPERLENSKTIQNVTRFLSEYVNWVPEKERNFDFKLINLDDESYHRNKFELPKC